MGWELRSLPRVGASELYRQVGRQQVISIMFSNIADGKVWGLIWASTTPFFMVLDFKYSTPIRASGADSMSVSKVN
jgi:hypothetical protein